MFHPPLSRSPLAHSPSSTSRSPSCFKTLRCLGCPSEIPPSPLTWRRAHGSSGTARCLGPEPAALKGTGVQSLTARFPPSSLHCSTSGSAWLGQHSILCFSKLTALQCWSHTIAPGSRVLVDLCLFSTCSVYHGAIWYLFFALLAAYTPYTGLRWCLYVHAGPAQRMNPAHLSLLQAWTRAWFQHGPSNNQ